MPKDRRHAGMASLKTHILGGAVSESIEMYLVMIALLREDSTSPVPLSLLAQRLAISPVSANEMCRKLEEQGLVQYQPYKGVTLAPPGESQAQAILSRRRLWVVFLVEELGIEPGEADEIACRLEHITSARLVSALRAYLERAPSIARGRSHPAASPSDRVQPLATCAAGQEGRVADFIADGATAGFLESQGFVGGAPLAVLAVGADGALLVELGERRLTVAASLAAQISLALPAGGASRPLTWEKCRAFWADPKSAGGCPLLADAGGALACEVECLAAADGVRGRGVVR